MSFLVYKPQITLYPDQACVSKGKVNGQLKEGDIFILTNFGNGLYHIQVYDDTTFQGKLFPGVQGYTSKESRELYKEPDPVNYWSFFDEKMTLDKYQPFVEGEVVSQPASQPASVSGGYRKKKRKNKRSKSSRRKSYKKRNTKKKSSNKRRTKRR